MFKLRQTYETEIYISEDGYIVIKQPSSLGEEPQMVLFSPEQAKRVAGALTDLAENSPDDWVVREGDAT